MLSYRRDAPTLRRAREDPDCRGEAWIEGGTVSPVSWSPNHRTTSFFKSNPVRNCTLTRTPAPSALSQLNCRVADLSSRDFPNGFAEIPTRLFSRDKALVVGQRPAGVSEPSLCRANGPVCRQRGRRRQARPENPCSRSSGGDRASRRRRRLARAGCTTGIVILRS